MPPIARVEPITTARALRGPFDYVRPDGVGVGSTLVVPFGGREVLGVVVGVAEESEIAADRLAAPVRVLEHEVPADLVDLAVWMAEEYCSTPARALTLVTPPARGRPRPAWWATATGHTVGTDRLTHRQRALLESLAAGGPRPAGRDLAALRRLSARGLVALERRAIGRRPDHHALGARRPEPPSLTADQEVARADIAAAIAAGRAERLLLHGVTGSGKTEVYLRAAAEVLDRGRGVIVLVPEIALTPQIVSRFADRFGDTVAVLHSALSDGARHDEWARLRSGEARVCIGARSAVFAPVADLGLVVVDEEHDASYKHEGDPRYDARHVAEWRARRTGAVLVAGSATPRPESILALRRLRLPTRVDGRPLPPVEVIDMRDCAGTLHPRTSHALADAGKAIVMLNRRGWSNFVDCRACGHAWQCPQCDVALVLHRAGAYLACHHCGHREGVPAVCSACGSVAVARHGVGTERLEHDLARLGHEVFRLDAEIARAGALLERFEAAPRGILVGTQMVAKGHDFPDVTLGVVLDADGTLRFPDFRAEERTFALVAQLAGRAGRGAQGGRVLVQTLAPDAPSILAAARHDADGFLAGELARREALGYPPYRSLIRIVCSALARDGVSPGPVHALTALRDALGDPPGAQVLGPAPLFRLRGRDRAQLVIKAADRAGAVAAVGAAVARTAGARRHPGVAFSVDVDPQ